MAVALRPRPPAARRRDRPALIRGEDSLARAYDFILDARFDQVDAELRRACGPAPPEACDVLAATALWWRILLDPDSRALDDEFITRRRARDRARPKRGPSARRTTPRRGSISAAPTRPACSGACCATRSWRRRATASASSRRSSARSRSTPLEDAYFGIGLYQVLRRRRAGGGQGPPVPAAAARRRQDGRARADAARARTAAACSRARRTTSSTSFISGTSARPARRSSCCEACTSAIRATRSSPRRSPTSRTSTSTTSPPASLPGARCWPPRASSASTFRRSPKCRRGSASPGSSRSLQQTDHAIELLRAVIVPRRSQAPYSARWPLAYLRSARRRIASDRARRRSTPIGAAQRRARRRSVRRRASGRRSACDARRTPGRAEAYRLSLEGWRRLEDDDLPAAAAALERSLGAERAAIRSRTTASAACSQARKDDAGALAHFELAIRNARIVPGADPRQRRTSKRRVSTSALGRRADAIATTAPRPRSSAPPQRRAPRRRARSRDSATATRRSRVAIARARRSIARRDRSTVAIAHSRRRRSQSVRIFDISYYFVLDTSIFSSIIYILYEGGSLSPPVVTLGNR